MRIHLACGTVYLKDWINIDLEQPNFYLAKDRLDLVEKNGTDIDHYYKEERTTEDFMKGKFHDKEAVVDMYADIRELPFEDNTVDEMVGMHIFEHFSSREGDELLAYWYRLLKKGGSLRLHVPDVRGIMEEYNKDKDIRWALRQLWGSNKNDFGIHKAGYVFETLSEKFERAGFKNVKQLENINSYSAIGILGTK